MPDISLIDKSLLDGLSEQEKKVLLDTLSKLSEGDNTLLNELTYADFAEIPVDVETFLHDKRYLGNGLIDSENRFTVFPYWEEMLKKLFPTNTTTRYNTLILTGSVGLGKSFIAVICMLYLMYRMLCLKDPYLYYGLQPIDKITFSLINVTIEAAKGVAWDKLQQLVQSSPWFMSHGKMSGRTDIIWTPDKRIELVVGSSNNAVIGRAVFCLDGNTEILTDNGYKKMKSLVDKKIRVVSYDNGKLYLSSQCTVKPTGISDIEYHIELEDGTIIKCTENHKFLLKKLGYIQAKDIVVGDILVGVQPDLDLEVTEVSVVTLKEPKQFYDVVEASPLHNFIVKTICGNIVSHNCNFTDEINFSAMTTDVEKIKKKQKLLISQVDARMQSRFMKGNYLPTLQIIASSKNSDQSFLDSYINTKKKNNSKTTLIIDEPQWVVRNDKQSDKKFYVAVGNKFLASEVLPLDAPETVVESFRAKGYQMLEVPSGYYENFIDNVDLALTDIAGISSTSALKYISGVRLNETKITSYKNPMTKEIIEVGTGDNIQYSQFFDLNSVPSTLKVKPLYIHLDMSKKGDRTGIAGVWIMGKRAGTSERKGDSEAYYRVAFAFAVQAPKGYEISFEKNRNFIRWLKSQGFKIAGVSADTYQSTQIMQQLQADGFNTKTISVDRLENIQGTNTKVCIPYAFFKTAIYEKRIEIFQKCDLLTNEIVNLERESDGHIDHPDGGTSGCFVGSTKVRLVDGRSLTMRELVDEYESGKENWVYSFNEETMKIEPKRIRKAWLTIKDAPLVKVTLDNGEEILCTPNHKFMLRDGSFCEAQDLISGVSLMPLYTKISNKGLKGYRLLYEPMEDKWHWEHRQFATEVLDERYLVHHKNCNPLDNTPTNLIWMSKQAHYEEHKCISTGTHSEEANEKRKKSIKEWHEKNRGTAVYEQRSKRLSMVGLGATTEQEWEEKKKERAAQKEATRLHGEELKRVAEENRMAKENRKREIEELFGIDDYDSLSISEKDSLGVKFSRIKDPTIIERTSVALSIAHKEGKFKNAEEALRAYNESMRGKKRSPEDLEKIREGAKNRKFTITDETKRKMSEATKRKRWCTDGETNIYIDKDADIPDGFAPGRTKTWKNHKVLKVEKVDFQEDVFDLEIEDNHNFALDAGVFVHNSKDVADAVCGSTYFASQNIEQFAYNYGEDLDYTLQTNKLNASSSEVKKQVNIAFEQELQNLLTPQSIKREQEEEKKRINNSPYGNRPIVTNGMLIW